MSNSQEAIRATASGRVQGVGYRASVVDRAREFGLLGWVRNQDDGTVLLHAEGDPTALRQLEAFLRDGPPAAEVAAVEIVAAKVEGHEQFAVRGVSSGRFVVEERAADDVAPSFLLRLEVDGTLRSWRLAKAPSMVPAEKRFASQVAAEAEPDPRDADGFFDHGTYEQGGRVAWPEAIERGHAVFVLHGEQLAGGFALQRTRGTGPSAGWLLIKRRDEFARAD
jgi:acylphosphatase